MSIARADCLQAGAVSSAAALFIWMYLASVPLGDAAASGVFGSPSAGLVHRAQEYGHEWRHGQTGWPIYVPGFIIAAFAMAPLFGAGLRRTSVVLALGLAAGWLVASPFAGAGAEWLAARFAGVEGLDVQAAVPLRHTLEAYPAAATFLAFSLLVTGIASALRTRRWAVLVVAAGAYALVALIRGGFAFGELARLWTSRAASGDATALLSIVVIVAASLVLGRLARAARAPSREPRGASPGRRTQPARHPG